MKITDIRVTDVNVPLDAPFWWTAGLYGGASTANVEGETDAAVVGPDPRSRPLRPLPLS